MAHEAAAQSAVMVVDGRRHDRRPGTSSDDSCCMGPACHGLVVHMQLFVADRAAACGICHCSCDAEQCRHDTMSRLCACLHHAACMACVAHDRQSVHVLASQQHAQRCIGRGGCGKTRCSLAIWNSDSDRQHHCRQHSMKFCFWLRSCDAAAAGLKQPCSIRSCSALMCMSTRLCFV